MIPGITASRWVTQPASVLWTPLNMATVPPIYLHMQESTVTDVSGAASAVSNLGSMGSDGAFTQSTAANRPAILAGELNGRRVLSFDGSTDLLTGGSAAQLALYQAAGHAWGLVVYKKRGTDGSDLSRILFQASIGTGTSSRFAFSAGFVGAGQANKPVLIGRRADADTQVNLAGASTLTGTYHVAFFEINYLTRRGTVYVDGQIVANNDTFTAFAQVTSNTPSQLALSIGAFSAGIGHGDVDIAAVVLGKTAPAAGEIDKLNGWAAHEWGLAGLLSSGHPYKTSAPTA